MKNEPMDRFKRLVDQSLGKELHGFLPGGRKCIIQHGDTLSTDQQIWDCWIYNTPGLIDYDLHWFAEPAEELVGNGYARFQVALLDICL